MTKLSPADIQHTGETQVELWLTNNGYHNVIREVLNPQESEIRAQGNLENIIVVVKTFLHPSRHLRLSDYETHKLSLRASRQKNAAYAAYVIINEDKELVKDIIWERLS